MGQTKPLFILFFSNKHPYNIYNKNMSKNVHPVYGAGIRTHVCFTIVLFLYKGITNFRSSPY